MNTNFQSKTLNVNKAHTTKKIKLRENKKWMLLKFPHNHPFKCTKYLHGLM